MALFIPPRLFGPNDNTIITAGSIEQILAEISQKSGILDVRLASYLTTSDTATREVQISTAIALAAANGITMVWVPTSMLPYNASLVTFNPNINMIREGGNPSVFDVRAYGAAGDAIT